VHFFAQFAGNAKGPPGAFGSTHFIQDSARFLRYCSSMKRCMKRRETALKRHEINVKFHEISAPFHRKSLLINDRFIPFQKRPF